jgi:hypothetical protein
MALPAVPDTAIIQAVFRASIDGNDPITNPLENVVWFQYLRGFGPDPTGIPINDMAFRASTQWSARWRAFMSSDCAYFSCTLRDVITLTPIAPDRYKATLLSQWTDTTPQGTGGVASTSLPSFNAFGVRKVTAAPGRGHQGQVRIPGVPQSSQIDNQLQPAVLAALDAALVPSFLNLNVSLALAFSDTLFPILIDGKLVNTSPGNPVAFYKVDIQGFAASPNVSTQVTRKAGRRRS